ncbi:MAG: D-Ala-D-Ala carboxypeptidase family metallohydrolase [Synechococcales bacterium]|nr:D-Ala-D-Ala carboxypeptidase family metallohydrolase [Synechococcales bacterium]
MRTIWQTIQGVTGGVSRFIRWLGQDSPADSVDPSGPGERTEPPPFRPESPSRLSAGADLSESPPPEPLPPGSTPSEPAPFEPRSAIPLADEPLTSPSDQGDRPEVVPLPAAADSPAVAPLDANPIMSAVPPSARQVLYVTEDTIFKLRPQQSIELSTSEQYAVKAGTAYDLQSYAYADITGDFNGHIKVALKRDSLRGLNTWFVYSAHAQVEIDGQVVYPQEDQEAIPIVRVTQDTLFKRRPLQSSALPDAEKYAVSRGQSFALHSYAYTDSQGNFASHIKIALRYPQDFIRGVNTWFVYDGHAYIEYDGDIVYPPEDPNLPTLLITQDTLFKRRPLQSSSLPPEELFRVSKGSVWKLSSYAHRNAQGADFNKHVKFALRYERDEINGFNTWYVYEGHAQVRVGDRVVYPLPRPTTPPPPPTPSYSGIPFRLPGNVSTFYTDQPIIPGGNFTWGEATKNASRIPDTVAIVDNIIGLARELQRARNQIGRPFQVNSWYRPPAINAAVGGASRSYHLTGRAADLEVAGYSGRQVANEVFSWWPGGIGLYSHLPNVVHLDTGPRRTWGF